MTNAPILTESTLPYSPHSSNMLPMSMTNPQVAAFSLTHCPSHPSGHIIHNGYNSGNSSVDDSTDDGLDNNFEVKPHPHNSPAPLSTTIIDPSSLWLIYQNLLLYPQ